MRPNPCLKACLMGWTHSPALCQTILELAAEDGPGSAELPGLQLEGSTPAVWRATVRSRAAAGIAGAGGSVAAVARAVRHSSCARWRQRRRAAAAACAQRAATATAYGAQRMPGTWQTQLLFSMSHNIVFPTRHLVTV